VQAALRKLLTALPAPLREGARVAGGAVVVDAAGWGRTAPPEPPHLGALQRAVLDGERVVLGYAGRDKPPSSRAVSPLGLVAKGGVWYLVAGTDAGVRTFRVGRVTRVTPTGEPVVRPQGFDLAAAWQSSAERVEQRRTDARVRALADPSIVPVLRGWLGAARVTVIGDDPDGRVEVEVAGRSVAVVAAEVAGFGSKLEIVAPEEAREQLAGLADDLRGLYGRRQSMAPAPSR
jgi:predicted DNA-binding transcriptional regulator YafY